MKFIDFSDSLSTKNLYPHFMPEKTLYVVVCADNADNEAAHWMEEIRRHAGVCPVILALNLTESNRWKERRSIQEQIRQGLKTWESGRQTPRPCLCAVIPFRLRTEQAEKADSCVKLNQYDWIFRRQSGAAELADAIIRQISEMRGNWQAFNEYCDMSEENYCGCTDIVRQSERILCLCQEERRKELFPSGGLTSTRFHIERTLENLPNEDCKEDDMERMLAFFEEQSLAFPAHGQNGAFVFPSLFQGKVAFEQYAGNLRFQLKLTEYPDTCAPMPGLALYRLAYRKREALDLAQSGKNVIAFREQGCQIQLKLEGPTLDIIVRDNPEGETPSNQRNARKCLHEFCKIAQMELQNCHIESTKSVVFYNAGENILYTIKELESSRRKKFFVPEGSCMGRAGEYSGKAILNAHSYDPQRDSVMAIFQNLRYPFVTFLLLWAFFKFFIAQIPDQLSAPAALTYLLLSLIAVAALVSQIPKWRKYVQDWIGKHPGTDDDIFKAVKELLKSFKGGRSNNDE